MTGPRAYGLQINPIVKVTGDNMECMNKLNISQVTRHTKTYICSHPTCHSVDVHIQLAIQLLFTSNLLFSCILCDHLSNETPNMDSINPSDVLLTEERCLNQ